MMRRIRILASFALVLPTFATAQHRGGTVSAEPAVVAAPHMAASAPHAAGRVSTGTRVATAPVGIHRVPASGTPTRNVSIMSGLRSLPLFPTNFSDVPGLGFDYPHLAAVSGGRIGGRFAQGTGTGFGFDGFLLSPSVVVVESQPEGQPLPVEDNAAANPAPESGRDLEDQFLPAAGTPSAPPRDTAEYVFVRRDGGLLFAVAYSWENGILRYVTRDGVRRSVSQDALDINATRQFNEQRGLNFRLPA